MLPQRVGVMGPSPPTMSKPSIIRPLRWADTEMPPPMWQAMKLQSSYVLPSGGGVPPRRLLQVESVKMHLPVDAFDAGHPGQILHLVNVGRVDQQGPSAVFLAELRGQLRTHVGRVDDSVGRGAGMLHNQVVDLVDAAFHGEQASALTHPGVDAGQRDVFLFEQVEDGLLPVGQLLGEIGERGQLLGVVGDVAAEDDGVVVEKGDLGGRRARVDGEDLIHLRSPGRSRTRWRCSPPTPIPALPGNSRRRSS